MSLATAAIFASRVAEIDKYGGRGFFDTATGSPQAPSAALPLIARYRASLTDDELPLQRVVIGGLRQIIRLPAPARI